MFIRLLSIVMVTSLLWGCSSAPTKYPNNLEKNLTINVKLDDKGGLLTSVDVVAGINDLDANCKPQYKGMIELEQGQNSIGLAPGVLTFIQVDIAHKSPGVSNVVSRGTMIKPETGKQYRVDISYIDDMFDFRLYEVSGSKRKQLKIEGLNGGSSRCKG